MTYQMDPEGTWLWGYKHADGVLVATEEGLVLQPRKFVEAWVSDHYVHLTACAVGQHHRLYVLDGEVVYSEHLQECDC